MTTLREGLSIGSGRISSQLFDELAWASLLSIAGREGGLLGLQSSGGQFGGLATRCCCCCRVTTPWTAQRGGLEAEVVIFAIVGDSAQVDANWGPSRGVESGSGAIIDSESDDTIDEEMEVEAVEIRSGWDPEPEANAGGARVDPETLRDSGTIIVGEHEERSARVSRVAFVSASGARIRPDKEGIHEVRFGTPCRANSPRFAGQDEGGLFEAGITNLLALTSSLGLCLSDLRCQYEGECHQCDHKEKACECFRNHDVMSHGRGGHHQIVDF